MLGRILGSGRAGLGRRSRALIGFRGLVSRMLVMCSLL